MTNERKCKRQTISLADKQTIIEASETKPKTADLVKHFDNKYVYTTIDTILKNKENILQAIDGGADGKRANLKGAKNPELEEALLTWFKDVRSENISVDSPLLKACFDFMVFIDFNFRKKHLN
jgi:hypothetical protein